MRRGDQRGVRWREISIKYVNNSSKNEGVTRAQYRVKKKL